MTLWAPIKTEPDDGNFRLYGLWVTHRNGHSWFEVHYVAHVDGELIEASGDQFSTWSFEDFELWAPAPQFVSADGEAADK